MKPVPVAATRGRLNIAWRKALRSMARRPPQSAVSATWLDRRMARRRVEMLRVAAVSATLLVVFVGVVLARDLGSRFLANLAG